MRSWSQPGFQLPQLWDLWSHVEIALYEGRGGDALEMVRGHWRDLRRSLLMFVHYDAVIALDLKVRAELAAALVPSAMDASANALRTQATKTISALRAQRAVWAKALADLADGCLERARGSTTQALSALSRAEAGFSSVAMNLHAAVARRRKGEWLGGDAGRTMVVESDTWMRNQGIIDPSKMARMLAPAPQG